MAQYYTASQANVRQRAPQVDTRGINQSIAGLQSTLAGMQSRDDKLAQQNLMNERAAAQLAMQQAAEKRAADKNTARLKQEGIATKVGAEAPWLSSVQQGVDNEISNRVLAIEAKYKGMDSTPEMEKNKQAEYDALTALTEKVTNDKRYNTIVDARGTAKRVRQRALDEGATLETADKLFASTLEQNKQQDLTERQKLQIQMGIDAANAENKSIKDLYNTQLGTTSNQSGSLGSTASTLKGGGFKNDAAGEVKLIESVTGAIGGEDTFRVWGQDSAIGSTEVGEQITAYKTTGIKLPDGKYWKPTNNDLAVAFARSKEYSKLLADEAYNKDKFEENLKEMAADSSKRGAAYVGAKGRDLSTTTTKVFAKGRADKIKEADAVLRRKLEGYKEQLKGPTSATDVIASLFKDYSDPVVVGSDNVPTNAEINARVKEAPVVPKIVKAKFTGTDPISVAMRSSRKGQLAVISVQDSNFKSHYDSLSKVQQNAVDSELGKTANMELLSTLAAQSKLPSLQAALSAPPSQSEEANIANTNPRIARNNFQSGNNLDEAIGKFFSTSDYTPKKVRGTGRTTINSPSKPGGADSLQMSAEGKKKIQDVMSSILPDPTQATSAQKQQLANMITHGGGQPGVTASEQFKAVMAFIEELASGSNKGVEIKNKNTASNEQQNMLVRDSIQNNPSIGGYFN